MCYAYNAVFDVTKLLFGRVQKNVICFTTKYTILITTSFNDVQCAH